jgi:hypothetical protein
MWQCRKIYANLLLLSVLLFALGASAAPRINRGFTGATAWNVPENGEIRWECCTGEIIYRGQQITALAGGELDFILPDKLDDILFYSDFSQELPGGQLFAGIDISYLPQGRAPPAV